MRHWRRKETWLEASILECIQLITALVLGSLTCFGEVTFISEHMHTGNEVLQGKKS